MASGLMGMPDLTILSRLVWSKVYYQNQPQAKSNSARINKVNQLFISQKSIL